jgi:hypothetical protein
MFVAVACAMHFEHACHCAFHTALTRRHAAHLPTPRAHRPDAFGIPGLAQSPADRRHHLATAPKVPSSRSRRARGNGPGTRQSSPKQDPLPPPRILAVRAWIAVDDTAPATDECAIHAVAHEDDVVIHLAEQAQPVASHHARIAPPRVHAADVDPRVARGSARSTSRLIGPGEPRQDDSDERWRRGVIP